MRRSLVLAILMAGSLTLGSVVVQASGIDSLTLTPSGSNTDFTITGTYTSTTPLTPFSSPGGAYSLTFSVPTTPTSVIPLTVDSFGIDATVSLNGVTFATSQVLFFDTTDFGGLIVCLGTLSCNANGLPPSPTAWSILGEQLFTGSVSNPTFISGSASIVPFGYALSGDSFYSVNGELQPTPEPSSLLLLGTGLLAVAARSSAASRTSAHTRTQRWLLVGGFRPARSQ